MRRLFPHHIPSWRRVLLWVVLGVLLGAGLHGYWLLFCTLLVAVVALFVIVS